jgi:hypothetical protein
MEKEPLLIQAQEPLLIQDQAITPFPLMKWSWSLYEKPIHIYYLVLWNKKCKNHLYDMCEFSMAPLHDFIFGQPTPMISKEAKIF